MNIGKGRWNSKYICDKCKQEIPYIGQKGFVGINHYSKSTQRETLKKTFDLCASCEKELREWLKEKPIMTTERIINTFPIWED